LKYLNVAVILSIALYAVVLVISLFFWNCYDISWWIPWFFIAEEKGIQAVYAYCSPPNCKAPYPPLAIMFFVASFGLVKIIGVPDYLVPVVLKFLMVIVPSILGFIVLKRKVGGSAPYLWLAGFPLFQLMIVLQFDVLAAVLLMLSLIFFLEDRHTLAGAFLALAALVKQALVLAGIVMALLLIKKRNWLGLRNLAFSALAVFSVFSLPFLLYDASAFVKSVVGFHAERLPQDLTFWALPVVYLGEEAKGFPFLEWAWIIPFSSSLAALAASIKLSNLDSRERYEAAALVYTSIALLVFVAFSKIGNPNYYVWVYPLLLMVAEKLGGRPKRFFYAITVGMTVAAAVNTAMLMVVPAIIGRPVFIVEDLAYYDARLLIKQSFNGELYLKISNLLDPYNKSRFATDDPIELLRKLNPKIDEGALQVYMHRRELISFAIALSQICITLLSVELMKCLKKV